MTGEKVLRLCYDFWTIVKTNHSTDFSCKNGVKVRSYWHCHAYCGADISRLLSAATKCNQVTMNLTLLRHRNTMTAQCNAMTRTQLLSSECSAATQCNAMLIWMALNWQSDKVRISLLPKYHHIVENKHFTSTQTFYMHMHTRPSNYFDSTKHPCPPSNTKMLKNC